MLTKRIAYLISLIFIITVAACAQDKNVDNSNISTIDFKQLVKTDSNIVILDVRTPEELKGELGQIPGVINIPVQELGKRYVELSKYKDKTVYVICRSGNRSKFGTKLLREKGFNAINVLGGMRAYNKLK